MPSPYALLKSVSPAVRVYGMLVARIAKSLTKETLLKKIVNELKVLRYLIRDTDHCEVPFDNQ
jgi:hypothetical protein